MRQQRHRANHTYVCQHESGPFSPSKKVAKHGPCHPQSKCIGEPRLLVTVTLVFQWLKKQNWRSLEPLSLAKSFREKLANQWLVAHWCSLQIRQSFSRFLFYIFSYLFNLERCHPSAAAGLLQEHARFPSALEWRCFRKQPPLLGFTSIHTYSLGGLNELITEERNADDDCHRHKVPDRRECGVMRSAPLC